MLNKIYTGRVVERTPRALLCTERADNQPHVFPYRPAMEDVPGIASGLITELVMKPGNPDENARPGDLLYIKEPWQVRWVHRAYIEVGYTTHKNAPLCEAIELIPFASAKQNPRRYRKADHYGPLAPSVEGGRWMPRWVSRLFLEVERVEDRDGQKIIHFTAYRGNVDRRETAMKVRHADEHS